MSRQYYKEAKQWIVIDDCEPRTEPTLGQTYLRGPKTWEPGINTHRLNLDMALKHVEGEAVFIIEDDDYYAANYLQAHVQLLKHAGAVGEARSRYFNVTLPGYKIMPNTKHSSLAQTSFRATQLKLFEQAVNSGDLYFDITFWKKLNEAAIPSLLISDRSLCVGIKGLPGREGISPAHRSRDFSYDPDFKVLKEWIGNDSNLYLKFKKRK